jgi:hypothetical protein
MVGVVALGLLAPEIVVPTAVGLGAALVVIVTLHFLIRGRPAPVSRPVKEQARQPEYDPFLQGSASEQRKAYRRLGNPVTVLIREPGSPREPRRGHVLDRSTGGVRLAVERMIPEGTALELLPANAPVLTPWVEVEVRRCHETPDGWEAGCEFVHTPPWSVLLMFG